MKSQVEMCLKIPNTDDKCALTRYFMDNTGSTMPRIFRSDLEQLVGKAGGERAPFLCYVLLIGNYGSHADMTCKLEFNMISDDQRLMRPNAWVPVQTTVVDAVKGPNDTRLGGGWMRRVFYVGSSPWIEDNLRTGSLCVSETKAGLTAMLPTVNVVRAKPADIYRPQAYTPEASLLPGFNFIDMVTL